MIKLSKIILGTASFGLKYGYKKKNKNLKKKEINDILSLAFKKKISYFDTAYDYGNCHQTLGDFKKINKIKVISKLPKKINLKKDNEIQKIIKKMLDDLNKKKIYGLLIHDYKQLKNNKRLFQDLINLKKKKIINKIGVSIYSEKEFYELKKYYNKIDILQLPINIFDQRLIDSNFLKRIKRYNIEIHARSIFLKGILLKQNFNKLPKYFFKWKLDLIKLKNFNKANNLTRLESCLNFVSNIKEIDKIIIGVKNKSQLEQILKISSSKKIKKNINFNKLKMNDIRLINPKSWTL